jgi:hypothetical protein
VEKLVVFSVHALLSREEFRTEFARCRFLTRYGGGLCWRFCAVLGRVWALSRAEAADLLLSVATARYFPCAAPQQCLYFLPEPQGHGSFLPVLGPARTTVIVATDPSS